MHNGMNEEAATVFYAILTGDSSGIETGLLDNVRKGGIAHIFAVSGLHVGALYAACRALFEKTKLKQTPRAVRFAVVSSVIIFYGGICGFSPSVVRAAVMCLVLYASALVGLKSDLVNNTGRAGLLILLLNPAALFGLGMQLSFVASLSIGVFSRTVADTIERGVDALSERIKNSKTFCALFQKPKDEEKPAGGKKEEQPNAAAVYFAKKRKRAVIAFVAATISAQIGTLPFQLDAFGYISIWALLLNCAFVPMISAAFSFMLAFAALALLAPIAVSSVLLYMPSVFWNTLLLLFHVLDFSAVVTGFSFGFSMIAYYIALILLSEKINLKKWVKIPLSALAFVVTVILLCV
jgi:ComEC/Rec2-related protein